MMGKEKEGLDGDIRPEFYFGRYVIGTGRWYTGYSKKYYSFSASLLLLLVQDLQVEIEFASQISR